MYNKKSDEALKTISEVSNIIDVSPSALRFWEKSFKHLRPYVISGMRYYSKKDIDNLKVIKTLLYDQGYTIAGAVKHLKHHRTSQDVKPLRACNESSMQSIKQRLHILLEHTRTAAKLLQQ